MALKITDLLVNSVGVKGGFASLLLIKIVFFL